MPITFLIWNTFYSGIVILDLDGHIHEEIDAFFRKLHLITSASGDGLVSLTDCESDSESDSEFMFFGRLFA